MRKSSIFTLPQCKRKIKEIIFVTMELHLIEPYPQQWILIILLASVFTLAVIRYAANVQLVPVINSFLQIKTADSLQDRMHPLIKILLLLNYTLVVSLVIAMAMTLKEETSSIDFTEFLKVLILVTSFLLVKRYLNLFLASLLGFLEQMQFMEIHRDRIRMLVGIPVLLVALWWTVNSGVYEMNWWIAISLSLLLVPLLIIRLILSVKELFINSVFYFIVYLCALEIGPYLLLYKYIIG